MNDPEDPVVEDPPVEDPPVEDPPVEDPPAEDPPTPQAASVDSVYSPDPILASYLISTIRYKADRVEAIADGMLDRYIECRALFANDGAFSGLMLQFIGDPARGAIIYDHNDETILFRLSYGNYRSVSADLDKVRKTYSELLYLINRFVRENNVVDESAWPKLENATLEAQFVTE